METQATKNGNGEWIPIKDRPSWTEADVAELKRLYEEGFSDQDIGDALGRSVYAVCRRRSHCGFVKRTVRRWSKADDRYVRRATKLGTRVSDMAKSLGRTEAAVDLRIRALRLRPKLQRPALGVTPRTAAKPDTDENVKITRGDGRVYEVRAKTVDVCAALRLLMGL